VKDRITQVAACAGWVANETPPPPRLCIPPPFETLVNAGLAVPYRVAELTGITTARLRAAGVPGESAAVSALESWLSGLPRGYVLVAHNGKSFDEPFLGALLARTGRPPMDAWARARGATAYLDSLALARALRETRSLPRHTLTVVHMHLLKVPFPAHDALEDVGALLRVMSHEAVTGEWSAVRAHLRRIPRIRSVGCPPCGSRYSPHWQHACPVAPLPDAGTAPSGQASGSTVDDASWASV
jgi:DNA polymerase III epsilon subunit-like protein